MEWDQPAVSLMAEGIGRPNTGSIGAGHSPPAADARLGGGRRAARHHRRQQRVETMPVAPIVYEMRARHEDGRWCEHYGDRDAVERVADELRAEGWRVTWFPIMRAPAAKMFWRG